MLKIKNDIDLKELEKYGFKLNDNDWYENDDKRMLTFNIYVKPISKEIIFRTFSKFNNVDNNYLDCLYDLIVAELVEKVE